VTIADVLLNTQSRGYNNGGGSESNEEDEANNDGGSEPNDLTPTSAREKEVKCKIIQTRKKPKE
jgi:hypothetical protein